MSDQSGDTPPLVPLSDFLADTPGGLQSFFDEVNSPLRVRDNWLRRMIIFFVADLLLAVGIGSWIGVVFFFGAIVPVLLIWKLDMIRLKHLEQSGVRTNIIRIPSTDE